MHRRPRKYLTAFFVASALASAGISLVRAAGGLEPEPGIAASPVLEDRYPARKVEFPAGVTSYADVTYSSLDGFRPLTLDIYTPTRARPSAGRPLIIYIHGGGWTSGHTRHSGAFENWPQALASLAARGYVVSSLNYRLSREAPFPAAIQDVKAAIRWLRAHAQEYGIDKNRVVLWGGSAGGQLAALAAVSCGSKELSPPASSPESDCVQGAVAWYGIFDFAKVPAPDPQQDPAASPVARYLGCAFPKCADGVIRSASPIRYVDASDPPMLLIHGINDRVVLVDQSKEFHAALEAAGVRAEMLLLPDVDHSFVGASAEVTRRASLTALERTVAFFDAITGSRSD